MLKCFSKCCLKTSNALKNYKISFYLTLFILVPLLLFTRCKDKVTDPDPGSISTESFSANYSTSDSKLLIGVCYYPWYTNGQHWNSTYMRAKLNPPQPPLLGEYDLAAAKIISQHVEWSVDSKIDFWISSWWGPGSSTDNVILMSQLNNNDFLSSMGYCLLYESSGRFGGLPINVDSNKISTFLTDIEYLIENHFHHSNYMKIDNKPVLYLYLTRTLSGNYKDLFNAADSLLMQNGYDGLYVVGDEVYWSSPNTSRARYMDAISCYNPHTSVDWVTNADKFVSRTGTDMYMPWMDKANDLGISFWVDVLPGFNDLGVRKEANHPVIERKDGAVFNKMLLMAGDVLSNQTIPLKVLVITSFNEWHEDTQIEPTIVTSKLDNDPFTYTDGFGYIGYGMKYLDAVKSFAESYGN
jgi:glycoprotein endo-alpha-1,2-mannosidase